MSIQGIILERVKVVMNLKSLFHYNHSINLKGILLKGIATSFEQLRQMVQLCWSDSTSQNNNLFTYKPGFGEWFPELQKN